MSDQLRDVMTRIAERADPSAPDPTLWIRARRARRRGALVTAAAVGAAVFVLAATVGVLVQPDPDRRDPSPTPAERPGIPTIVRGIWGDGDLELETDLAVGPASVAIANPTGAFVVTADDGVYHRLKLPGFDPAVYDDPEVRRTGMVGLSLSPDGTRLAFGWHAPLPADTGQESGFVRSGLRILDLPSGEVEDVPEDRQPPSEFAGAIDNEGIPWGRVPYGMRWSPSGRYLAYEQVWAAAPPEEVTVEHWGQGLDDAYRQKAFAAGTSVYDTETGRRFDVRENRSNPSGFWLSGMWSMEGWPRMVGDDGTVAIVSVNNTLEVAPPGGRVVTVAPLPGGAAHDDHTVGLFDGRGRAIIETRAPSSHLLAVDLRTGAQERLELPLAPVHVDLVGWIGRGHVLAQVRQGDEQNLIVFDLSDAEVETNLVAPFDDEGTDSTFSFATDFATVRHPTTDFTEATDSHGGSADSSRPGAVGADGGGDCPGAMWLVAGLVGGLAAAAVVVVALRRRIRKA
jgi:hypothetical protein